MAAYMTSKDPNNIEPYFIVWGDPTGTNTSGDDGELQGATISSATWTVPTGITKASDNTSAVTIAGVTYPINTVTTVWLSGGTDGTEYTLSCRIVTSDGRTLDRSITIPVVSH